MQEEETIYFRTLVEFEKLVERYGAEQVIADMAPSIRMVLYKSLEDRYGE